MARDPATQWLRPVGMNSNSTSIPAGDSMKDLLRNSIPPSSRSLVWKRKAVEASTVTGCIWIGGKAGMRDVTRELTCVSPSLSLHSSLGNAWKFLWECETTTCKSLLSSRTGMSTWLICVAKWSFTTLWKVHTNATWLNSDSPSWQRFIKCSRICLNLWLCRNFFSWVKLCSNSTWLNVLQVWRNNNCR